MGPWSGLQCVKCVGIGWRIELCQRVSIDLNDDLLDRLLCAIDIQFNDCRAALDESPVLQTDDRNGRRHVCHSKDRLLLAMPPQAVVGDKGYGVADIGIIRIGIDRDISADRILCDWSEINSDRVAVYQHRIYA